MKKVWKTFSRGVEVQKTNFAEAIYKQFSGLKVTAEDVKHVILKYKFNVEKPSSWGEEEVFRFAQALRKETKKMIIAANKLDMPKAKENLQKIKKEFDYSIVPCFAEGELSLRSADKAGLIDYVPGESSFEVQKTINDKQKEALQEIKEVMEEYGSTGVQEVLNKVIFEILEYIAIFPAGDKLADSKGNILPDCFLMPPNSTALDFAFRLHSDIGKNFVKAIHIKTKQAVGKDYKLKHLDGLEIMTK